MFGDYEVPTDVGGESVDTDPVDTGPVDTDPVDTGAVDTETADGGGDTGPGDATDAEDTGADTGQTPKDTAMDVADTDAAADQGLPPNQCPSSRPSYRIRQADAETEYAVDGVCQTAEYGHAIRLPFPPPGTEHNTGINNTNNTADCHIVWFPGATPKFQACCDVEDADMVANAEPGDSDDKIFGSDEYAADDRIEMWLKCDLGTSSQDCGYKMTINNRVGSSESGMEGGRPTHFDSKEKKDESFEWLDEAWVVRKAGERYVLEWRGDIPFEARSGGTHACGFGLFDIDRSEVDDAPTENGKIRPFAGDLSINDPATWGCCFLE